MNTIRRVILAGILTATLAAPPLMAGTVAYSYDEAGRLISAAYDNSRFIDYRYDAMGNILSRTAGTALAGNVYPDAGITLKDAIYGLQIAGGLTPEGATARADVNDDLRVGLPEVIYVLRELTGP